MVCDYDGREITGEPYKVIMRKAGEPEDESEQAAPVGYRYFHDDTCYELFVADEAEFEPL